MHLTRSGLRAGLVILILAVPGILILRPRPVNVETARVVRGPLQETVDDEGEARVRERFVITAPVAGRLERVTLRAGDTVARGGVVARMAPAPLDPRAREQARATLEAALDTRRTADAAVASAGALRQQAARELVRARELSAQGLLSTEALERAKLDDETGERRLEAARFEAEAAAHRVELARAGLLASTPGCSPSGCTLSLTAPITGRVLRVPEQSARSVAAGETIMEIGDPARLEIVVDLLSTDAVKVRPGDRMLIEAWGGGHALQGRVRMVEPAAFTKVSALGVEEQRVNVVGDIRDTATELGDRYRVQVRVVLWEADSVLKAPSSALFRSNGEWHVFTLSDGRIRLRPVEPGHAGPFETEILNGLVEGDIIVRHPTDRLTDGLRARSND